ncbi:twin-arginine translocation signal domain-containing protein [Actimicrobium sp. CCI2.3]
MFSSRRKFLRFCRATSAAAVAICSLMAPSGSEDDVGLV